MRNQDLIAVARARSRSPSAFRTTIGLPGTLATRLQPNHPTDDPRGIAAAMLDGLLLGCGDAVIGINPATDSPHATADLLHLLDDIRQRYDIPTQSCVLSHVTTTHRADRARALPSIWCSSRSPAPRAPTPRFGVDIALLREGNDGRPVAEPRHRRRQRHVPRDRAGLGAELRRPPRHGGRPSTSRRWRPAPTRWRAISNRCWSTPSSDSSARSTSTTASRSSAPGLEDHFCGKLLGLPMGVDVCYTNHAEADQDDMDTLLTLLGAAGVAFVIAVPGADDVMLGYQSLSFHDALYARQALGLRPAPEFEAVAARPGHGRRRRAGVTAGRRCDQSPLRALTGGGADERASGARLLGRTAGARPRRGSVSAAPATRCPPAVLEFRVGPRRRPRRRARAAGRRRRSPPGSRQSGIGEPVGGREPGVRDRGEYLRRPDLGRLPADLMRGARRRRPISASSSPTGCRRAALIDHGVALLTALVAQLRRARTRWPRR